MATKTKVTEVAINDKRRSQQIVNRLTYRLNKRRNLWLRSIAAAKDPAKITVLEAKIEAIDVALAEVQRA